MYLVLEFARKRRGIFPFPLYEEMSNILHKYVLIDTISQGLSDDTRTIFTLPISLYKKKSLFNYTDVPILL